MVSFFRFSFGENRQKSPFLNRTRSKIGPSFLQVGKWGPSGQSPRNVDETLARNKYADSKLIKGELGIIHGTKAKNTIVQRWVTVLCHWATATSKWSIFCTILKAKTLRYFRSCKKKVVLLLPGNAAGEWLKARFDHLCFQKEPARFIVQNIIRTPQKWLEPIVVEGQARPTVS